MDELIVSAEASATFTGMTLPHSDSHAKLETMVTLKQNMSAVLQKTPELHRFSQCRILHGIWHMTCPKDLLGHSRTCHADMSTAVLKVDDSSP